MKDLLFRIWKLPRWVHFTIPFVAVLVVAIFRVQLAPVVGDKLPFGLFTVAVAIAALTGGLMPGILATALSLITAWALFASPDSPPLVSGPEQSATMIAFSFIWLFISIVCDVMRKAALNIEQVAEERDSNRTQMTVILSEMSDAFFALDKQWCVTHANAALLKMADLTHEQIIGQLIWDVIPDEDSSIIRESLVHSMVTKKPMTFDIPQREINHWLQMRAQPNTNGMFVYIQDITDRKLMDQARERLLADERKARSDAEHASQLKDEFVATLSHELRTPLTTILGWSEILGQRSKKYPEIVEGLQAIERSTHLQVQLIDDLLDMSRINAGKLRLQIEHVEMGQLICEIISSFETAADARKVRLISDVQRQECFVRGDATRLTQIVSNLVSNAIKFTKAGGTVTVTLMEDGPTAVIAVRDTGEGIDLAFLPAIFDRFRQANSSISRRHGGLGLGLSIVKQLTELHGGSVEAFSQGLGEGSCFTVRLTTVTGPRIHDGRYINSDKEIKTHRVDGLKILIVEDDDATRDLLNVMLREAGATLESAESAERALELFATFQPQILISDVGMPDVDGYELIRRVRRLPGGELPAIALTAFARKEDRDNAIEAGFDEHQTKPIDLQRLLAKINHLHRLVTE